MRRRNIRKFIILVLILCISIGFAVITASLTMNASFSFSNNSFDLHFSNIKVLSTSTVTSPTATITDTTSINYSGTFNKPGDYIEFSFYIVNGGTIDGQINQINTNLTTEQLNYISYSLKYEIENTNVSLNDYIYAGQARKVIAHFEYKEDIDEFIDLSSLNLNLTMKFIQPQTVTTTVWNYEYSGTEQYFIVPKTGTYKLEVWGAQGGSSYEENNDNYRGGYGGYSKGNITLTKNSKLYITIGGAGNRCACWSDTDCCGENGGYNGGGKSRQYSDYKTFYGSGGGATHIAAVTGLLSSLTPNTAAGVGDIIIVAGGGGGASLWQYTGSNGYNSVGGSAGGMIGSMGVASKTDRNNVCTGGSQTAAGEGYGINAAPAKTDSHYIQSYGEGFGQGGYNGGYLGPGSGGGYYGGGASEVYSCGGSGYIGSSRLSNKIMYCYNCQDSTEETDETNIKTRSTTNVSSTATANYAKIGNGYAKITFVS